MYFTQGGVFYTEDVIDSNDDGDEGRIITCLTEVAVCRWRVKSGRVKGIGKEDLSSFCLEGRAENTVKNYGGAFRFVWSHAKVIGRSVFEWDEGEERDLW